MSRLKIVWLRYSAACLNFCASWACWVGRLVGLSITKPQVLYPVAILFVTIDSSDRGLGLALCRVVLEWLWLMLGG